MTSTQRLLRRLLFVAPTRVLWVLGALAAAAPAGAANTIRKDTFNFGHQLGYLYSRIEDAELPAAGEWRFETGFVAYHTDPMPLVRNPDWRRRTLLTVPGRLEIGLAPIVALQLDGDLVAELPYRDIHQIGGNSPRVRTRIRLLEDRDRRPALALTLGVKFSSGKPYTLWDGRMNYDDSNGLAGIDTGVADYFIILSVGKRLGDRHRLLARAGLAPVGDPAQALERGGSQADQIPYGLAWIYSPVAAWQTRLEWAGFWGALTTTRLDHYSVARAVLEHRWPRVWLAVRGERGLTPESDDWVGGAQVTIVWRRSDVPAGAGSPPHKPRVEPVEIGVE